MQTEKKAIANEIEQERAMISRVGGERKRRRKKGTERENQLEPKDILTYT